MGGVVVVVVAHKILVTSPEAKFLFKYLALNVKLSCQFHLTIETKFFLTIGILDSKIELRIKFMQINVLLLFVCPNIPS